MTNLCACSKVVLEQTDDVEIKIIVALTREPGWWKQAGSGLLNGPLRALMKSDE